MLCHSQRSWESKNIKLHVSIGSPASAFSLAEDDTESVSKLKTTQSPQR
jgi:hypothetical protein